MAGRADPVTKEELRESLDSLLRRAYENEIDVANGGYALTHDDAAVPDWDVVITRVEE